MMKSDPMAPQRVQWLRSLGTKLAPGSRWAALTSRLLVALLVLVAVATLNRPYTPHVDEAWNASRVQGMLTTGQPFGVLDAGVFDRFDGYWTYFPWLGTALYALPMSILGVNLVSLRVVALGFCVLLLWSVYSISNNLYGPVAALGTVALLGLSSDVAAMMHLGRHDIVVAAMGYGAIAFYLSEAPNTKFPIKSFIAGLLVSLTLDVHPNGIIFLPVLGFMYLADYKLRVFARARAQAFGVGVVAGIAFYIAMHLLPYPQTYRTLYQLGNGTVRTPPLLTLDPLRLVSSLQDTLLMLGGSWVLLLVVSSIILVLAGYMRHRRELLITALLIAAFVCAISVKQPTYTILLIPMVSVLAGKALLISVDSIKNISTARGGSLSVPGLLRLVPPAALQVLLVISIAHGVASWPVTGTDDFMPTLARIQQAIPPHSSLIGSQIYWFGLPDRRYLSWEQIIYYQHALEGSNTADALRGLRPEYFILDDSIARYTVPDADGEHADVSSPQMLRASILSYLNENADIVDAFPTKDIGSVAIYKLRYPESETESAK